MDKVESLLLVFVAEEVPAIIVGGCPGFMCVLSCVLVLIVCCCNHRIGCGGNAQWCTEVAAQEREERVEVGGVTRPVAAPHRESSDEVIKLRDHSTAEPKPRSLFHSLSLVFFPQHSFHCISSLFLALRLCLFVLFPSHPYS